MKTLIKGGRVIDPASGYDEISDVALVNAEVVAIKNVASDFNPDTTMDATGCIVMPGLLDLAVRLREPGHEHEGMLASEMAAAVAGGVTSVVCPPDTEPVLDEAGLDGMECIHTKHSTSMSEHYLEVADRFGLLVTGGSDCHGRTKNGPLLGTIHLPYQHVEKLKQAVTDRRRRPAVAPAPVAARA